jgi:putative heme-binding domain-containing protein
LPVERLKWAEETVDKNHSASPERLQALRLLSLDAPAHRAKLVNTLRLEEPAEAQAIVLEELGKLEGIAPTLIEKFRQVQPGLRSKVIDLFVERHGNHEALLQALEKQAITPGELNLDLEQRRKLLRGGNPDIQKRASKYFGDEEYSNRKVIVEEWMKKIPQTGDATKGRIQFEKICITCHRKGSLGVKVGPDLSDLSHRSVEDILSNILDPNMAINPAFVTVRIDAEESEMGILAGETEEAVTLLQAQEVKKVFPRKSIKKMELTGLSLMPEGLESGFTPQEMRDLIAFLQQRE